MMITEAYFLSDELTAATSGSRELDRQIRGLFSMPSTRMWTRDFDSAAELFKSEFPDWSRNCLSNSCQGIYWYIDHDDGQMYGAVAQTDALALCAAMVKAKGKVELP